MIIGISGKMESGKSTFGRLLAGMLTGPVATVPFALALKEEVAQALEIIPPSEVFLDENKNREFIVPRQALRLFGMDEDMPRSITLREAFQRRGREARNGSPGYWVYRIQERIDRAATARHVIIDDVRYPNEARFVLASGGLLIRIHPHQYWQAGPFAGHESETALDDWHDWGLELHPEFGALEGVARKVAEYIQENH